MLSLHTLTYNAHDNKAQRDSFYLTLFVFYYSFFLFLLALTLYYCSRCSVSLAFSHIIYFYQFYQLAAIELQNIKENSYEMIINYI